MHKEGSTATDTDGYNGRDDQDGGLGKSGTKKRTISQFHDEENVASVAISQQNAGPAAEVCETCQFTAKSLRTRLNKRKQRNDEKKYKAVRERRAQEACDIELACIDSGKAEPYKPCPLCQKRKTACNAYQVSVTIN